MSKLRLLWPAYACDYANGKVAVASFVPAKRNELMLYGIDSTGNMAPLSPAPTPYKMAATKAAFSPKTDLLALSGSDVTIFKVHDDDGLMEQAMVLACGGSLRKNSIASEGVIIPDHAGSSHGAAAHQNSSAPITALSWCPSDPTLLVTASYDTTCTIWSVETGAIKTQLIAHDKEVFDVCFAPNRSDTFVSVGAEGSLRLFDTRYELLFTFIHTNW